MDKSQLSQRFINFANLECHNSSKLYEYLSIKIAQDEELLELCKNARDGQPVPNLFLGAVHYLLLKGNEHSLKEYYPSMTNNPRNIEDAFDHFKDFCHMYRDEIIPILKNKLVQTNEVRRCAYLYPLFCYIHNIGLTPLSLIEIGTSAGLQLLWDKYSYSYGTGDICGDKHSAVHIKSEIIGNNPGFAVNSPPVTTKVGLDLHINDLNNGEDYLWLKSLIWPEHNERLEMFENAAKCLKENPVKLIEGDGITLLTDVVEDLPKDTTICIFHTHVANQIPEASKHELINTIKRIGKRRDVFHLYNNMWDRKLHLDYFLNGKEYSQTIGETDGHGRWFQWNLK